MIELPRQLDSYIQISLSSPAGLRAMPAVVVMLRAQRVGGRSQGSPPAALARPRLSSSRRAGCRARGNDSIIEVLAVPEVLGLLGGTCRLEGSLPCLISEAGAWHCAGWRCVGCGVLVAGCGGDGRCERTDEAAVVLECGRIMLCSMYRV